MINHIIIWEKWQDPFGLDEEIDIEEDYSDDDNDIDNQNVFDRRTQKTPIAKYQAITTPFGIMPITENTASGKIFNFWTGHTNFAITGGVSSIIEDTEGVETLNVFTKYRFRIAIGKAFKDSIVMRNINNRVYEYLGDNYYV